MFKKTGCLILIFTILLTSFSSVFAQNNMDIVSELKQVNEEVLVEERVVGLLEEKEVKYLITKDGNIQLENPTPKLISELNKSLIGTYESLNKNTRSSTYPTPFYPIKTWNRRTSKHFIKATKTAFASAIFGWVFGWATSAKEISKMAASGFGTYYFVDGNEENVYYSTTHYYRLLGPGYFDSLGNHYGEYQMKRVDRTTKSSNHTGGQTLTKYQKSTSLVAIP